MGKGLLPGAVMASVVACVTLVLALACLPVRAQTAFDRPGGDYFNTPVTSGDPEDCALLCERDRRCRSWSFSYPDIEGGSALCWLKNTVPPRVPESCCISGVRGAGVIEPRIEGVETSIDRPGGDLRNFELKAGEGVEACKAACTADNKCRAFTFARPGYTGREARCFLKKEIKPPRRKAGFASGVVR
ncbi:apple domain-containing protein [Bradyrhizobium centrolobii]|uniref:Apple domain-containing protein n=1 Tax=Bradyrhizobium centrolobii TaxID=1505087 RepID=A0A176Z2D2_9BRAD|nr:PAN domain-containing protein [Bradyrhizobium centrolobii]OAF14828.1 apple domain-containing protein [Bradyrhizobium centrolobii]